MRRLDHETETFTRQEEATAKVRAEILRQAHNDWDTLATSFSDLLGDGGPADETADEMIKAIRDWRDTSSNRSIE